ncbi:unnamed protein product [marine sediment metagenome]|uniref:Uncharacterized protein n=1 Tax=marine sediment metagenome TaxID=412755 RepID=X1F2F7_9ZZZZ
MFFLVDLVNWGVPKAHRIDRMSTAVQKTDHPQEFSERYKALLKHYFLKKLFAQLNAGRQQKLEEELKVLRRPPLQRLEAFKSNSPIQS